MKADQIIKKEFGKKIQELRRKRSISQEDLADAVGVHRTYMGFVERGERNPTLTKVYKIAASLKVKASDLLAGID